MSDKLSLHPCFDPKARHKYGRIHLPVAPRCNVQCNYCLRDFDCVNESRPGVTSGILSPAQAIEYLDKLMSRKKNITVVGIAGPGDPFANPEETLETLRLVREKYPEVLLCLATNGLNILPYINELKEFNISHVTITINAVDPEIVKKVYAWFRYDKRVHNPDEGAAEKSRDYNKDKYNCIAGNKRYSYSRSCKGYGRKRGRCPELHPLLQQSRHAL
jgi:nitrogen fixation protein NifB